MSETRGPLTAAELALVLDRNGDLLSEVVSEREYQIVEAMAREILMHRDAMAPAMLRATRLYTDELGALRKRVAELETAQAWAATDERIEVIRIAIEVLDNEGETETAQVLRSMMDEANAGNSTPGQVPGGA
jgi:hypothetical protein